MISLRRASEYDRASLRGLSGAALVIEELHPAAIADGLSEDSIRTAVELILRSSGIRILGGNPSLCVRVTTSKSRAGYHFYAIQVRFKQKVSLVGQPEWSGFGKGVRERLFGRQSKIGHQRRVTAMIAAIYARKRTEQQEGEQP
jgi:hypothetical protein